MKVGLKVMRGSSGRPHRLASRAASPWALVLRWRQLASTANDGADEKHQDRERREQHRFRHVRGCLAADCRAPDTGNSGGTDPHVTVASCPLLPVRGDRTDQRGHSDHHQRAGGRLGRALVQGVDEDRDGQDRTTPAQGPDAEPDQCRCSDRESQAHAWGPTRWSPTFLLRSRRCRRPPRASGRRRRAWMRRRRRGSRPRSAPKPHRPGLRPRDRAAREAGCSPHP